MSNGARRVIDGGLWLALALLAANAAFTYLDVRRVVRGNWWVEHTRQVVAELEHAAGMLKDAETGQRGYLLTGKDEYLRPYIDATNGLDKDLDRLADLTSDNPGQQARVAELRRVAAEKIAELRQTVALRHDKGLEAALEVVQTDRGQWLMDRARMLFGEMKGAEEAVLVERSAASRAAVWRTVATGVATSALVASLLFAVAYLRRRYDAERERAAEAIRQSESWLSTTLISIGDAVIATDGAGRVKFMNPVAEALTGWHQAEAVGRSIEDVFHIVNEETRRPAEDPTARVIREGVTVGLANHTVVIARDGTETAIEDSAAPIKDASGHVVGVVMVFIDATERRRHERQLQESEERSRLAEERLRLMIESVQDYAIFATDLRGRVTTWNAGAERLFGYREGEILGRGVDLLFTPEDRASGVPQRELGEAAESGRSGDDRWHIRKDGTRFYVDGAVTPVRDGAGSLVGFTKVARDVTERKRFEEELRAAKEAAEDANRAKDDFLAVLSHELRTPLNPILLATTAMLDRPTPPEEVGPTLAMIRQNVNLQARLIDDLLDVMRIVRGKMPLHWGVSDCHDLIRRAAEITRSEALGKGHSVDLDLAAEDHCVNADAARLQQVFWNLIKNAVKFTPEGGTIAVRTRNEGEAIVVEVADTGIGIAPDVLPHVFDAFHQGDARITRKFGGLGLGLAICRGVVEAHGGTIAAESEGQGRGTRFRITLKAMPMPRDLPRCGDDDDARPPAPAPTRLGILLVEDDPTTLRMMAKLLGGLGHSVVTAGTVADAWAALQRADGIDLVISDIGLPDGSGLDLMRTVKAVRSIPAIALTGYGMDEDIRRSREAGFTTHMTKPIDFTKLEAMIRQVAI